MAHTENESVEAHILEAIRAIKYGAVEVLIHNSRIVQIEKTEKLRFDSPKPGAVIPAKAGIHAKHQE